MKIVYGLPPKIRYADLGLDLEIFHANSRQLHRPYGDFASLGISDGKTVWMVEQLGQVEKALQRVNSCRWVFHNASFDLRHLRRWADVPPRDPDRFWDTQLVERLLWGGWYDDFSLGGLARRYLGVYLEKETREEYAQADVLTPAMRRYAAKDPYHTVKVAQKQMVLMERDPQSKRVWERIDAPMLWATLDFQGIMLDTVKWKALTEMYRAKADALEAELGFNPNSPPQTRQALEKVGIYVASTGEETLKQYLQEPLVKKILDCRQYATRASRYGDNILAMVEADGRIYCNIKVTGAETGRTASDGPNLQNQPNETAYRDCYIAPRGRRIVRADYAKQEPCVLAEVSRDPELMRALETGENVHLNAGRLVFGNPNLQEYDQDGHKTKEYRIAKDLNLGISYNMKAHGLALRTGLSVDYCQHLIDAYFARFKGIKSYQERSIALGTQDGFVRSPAGRKIWINPYSYQADNNRINGPIQAGGADMIKLAAVRMHARFMKGEYGSTFPIIGPIHDELLSEIDTRCAKKLAGHIQKEMEAAFREICPHVKAKTIVDLHITHSWA